MVELKIDQYSVAAIPVELFFNDTLLSHATAFTWLHEGSHYLITNWHNVSGRSPETGKHLSDKASEPNRLSAWLNARGKPGLNRQPIRVDLRDAGGVPLWLVHDVFGHGVDVVALKIAAQVEIEMHPINTMPSDDLALRVGMDVFVLGFPFNFRLYRLPVWKRGSLASEPRLTPSIIRSMLVDTAPRPGMSGSPVIRRSFVSHMMEDETIALGSLVGTRFVGVYSGRLSTVDPWKRNWGSSGQRGTSRK